MMPDHNSEIAKRAYVIWEGEGRPSGKELDHWLRAEAELKAEHTEPCAEAPKDGARVKSIPLAPSAKPLRPAARRTRRTQ